MTAAEKLIAFIRNSFDTALYFAVMAVKENFRNYVGRAGTVGRPAQLMVILGNGPSLTGDLPRLIERREYETEDFLAVNFFAEDDRFEVVKPKYYVLSDPMFFRDSSCTRDRVRALYATLARKVAWPMNLYVRYYNPEGFDYRAALPNSISASSASIPRCTAVSEVSNFGFSAAGWEAPIFQNEYVGAGRRIRRCWTDCWGNRISGSTTFTAWTIRCWTDSAGRGRLRIGPIPTDYAAAPRGSTAPRFDDRRRRAGTRRFPRTLYDGGSIWPKSPNCSAATKSCAIMPPRSVRGSWAGCGSMIDAYERNPGWLPDENGAPRLRSFTAMDVPANAPKFLYRLMYRQMRGCGLRR